MYQLRKDTYPGNPDTVQSIYIRILKRHRTNRRQICIYTNTGRDFLNEELVYTIMETKKSHDLLSVT